MAPQMRPKRSHCSRSVLRSRRTWRTSGTSSSVTRFWIPLSAARFGWLGAGALGVGGRERGGVAGGEGAAGPRLGGLVAKARGLFFRWGYLLAAPLPARRGHHQPAPPGPPPTARRGALAVFEPPTRKSA